MADNDTDVSKTHLNTAEQIIQADFYLHFQNTENFALCASRPYEPFGGNINVKVDLSNYAAKADIRNQI